MPNVIVSDTSCLILFYKIGELDLLKKLFGKLHITDIVLKEFNQPIPDWIEIVELTTNLHQGLSSYLDKGEATAISLASEHENSLLIIDEIKGRKAAKEMGISVTGSLGVLIVAKKKGLIQAVEPLIEKIQQTNFRISEELIEQVLKKVNDS
jgi:predicted nucleic acid-binding protein